MKESLLCENKAINHKIKNIPADNDRYYIKMKKDVIHLQFQKICNKKKKDRLFELISNTDKKVSRTNSNSEKFEVKLIKIRAIQMLEYLGETYMSTCRHFFLLFKKLCEDKIKLKQTEDLSNMLSKDENSIFFMVWIGLQKRKSAR